MPFNQAGYDQLPFDEDLQAMPNEPTEREPVVTEKHREAAHLIFSKYIPVRDDWCKPHLAKLLAEEFPAPTEPPSDNDPNRVLSLLIGSPIPLCTLDIANQLRLKFDEVQAILDRLESRGLVAANPGNLGGYVAVKAEPPSQPAASDLIERCTRHHQALAPHVKERKTAKLFKALIDDARHREQRERELLAEIAVYREAMAVAASAAGCDWLGQQLMLADVLNNGTAMAKRREERERELREAATDVLDYLDAHYCGDGILEYQIRLRKAINRDGREAERGGE